MLLKEYYPKCNIQRLDFREEFTLYGVTLRDKVRLVELTYKAMSFPAISGSGFKCTENISQVAAPRTLEVDTQYRALRIE